MAKTDDCPVCGMEVDTRGLSGHLESHDQREIVSAVADAPSTKKSMGKSRSQAEVSEDSVTVRQTREVVVEDDQLKRDLVDELKKMVSSGAFKAHTSKRRFD